MSIVITMLMIMIMVILRIIIVIRIKINAITTVTIRNHSDNNSYNNIEDSNNKKSNTNRTI